MADKHSIFNLAAGWCGEPPLQNTDEASETGRLLRAHWTSTVLYCIEAYSWDFLEVRRELSRSSATPAWGFAYYYELPPDCERICVVSDTGLEDDDTFTGWRDESGKIATNAEAIYIRYVSSTRKTTPGSWSETFAHWVASELAVKIAPKVNSKAIDIVFKLAKKYRTEASRNDASGNARRELKSGTWSRAPRWRQANREQGR